MRKLQYRGRYKVARTEIRDGKILDNPSPEYYGRFSTITTKYGIVMASEMNWAHNNGRTFCTLFSTVTNGWLYSAWLEEAELKDRTLKWMATHFIKNIKP